MDSSTIFGVLGNITAFITFLLPARFIFKIRIISSGTSTPQYRPVPYLYHAAIITCALWLMYGSDKFLVFINIAGLIMHVVYLTVLIRFSRTSAGMMQNYLKHCAILLFELSSAYALTCLALTFHDPARFSGTLCAIGTTFICVMKMLCEPKKAPFLCVFELVAWSANGVIWTIYALISSDTFILVPNIVGALLGLVQLVTYAIRYKAAQERRRNREEAGVLLRTEPDLPEP